MQEKISDKIISTEKMRYGDIKKKSKITSKQRKQREIQSQVQANRKAVRQVNKRDLESTGAHLKHIPTVVPEHRIRIKGLTRIYL